MHRPEFPFARPQPGAAIDAELGEALLGCARHSLPALRRIHELMAPRLLAELLQMLGERRLAEAALVDCFTAIWQQAGSFNPQRNQPRAWLLSLARHHAVDLMRETQVGTPEEVDHALCFLRNALHEEGVPAEQDLLHLAWRSGRSPAEIAHALQCPPRRVQQEIRRSLVLMAESLRDKPQIRALDYVAAAHALGTSSPRVRRRFKAMLMRDIAARRAWQQWEQRLSTLTPDIPTVRPPDNAWGAVEKRVDPKTAARTGSQLRWLLAAAAVAAIALVMVWRKVGP
jgi:DNA-directed RNA polymerase specialized sigma24 family protein